MALIDLLRGDPYRARDGVGRRVHVEHGARVDDRHILVAGIEPTLELGGRDARGPQGAEKTPSLEVLDENVTRQSRRHDDDEGAAKTGPPRRDHPQGTP